MSELPSDDRGFTLGDGLFETVLADRGKLVLWDGHMERLARGCDVLELPRPSMAACREASEAALLDAGLSTARAAVRLSWSAGSGGRGLDRPQAPQPRLIVSASPAPAVAAEIRAVVVGTRRNDGSQASRLKTLAYLDNVLARREARAAGADEALMLNTRGELACAAAANLFWIADGVLFTPALECGVLDGLMRRALLDRARSEGWNVLEVAADAHALKQAEAVLITNSLIGAVALAAVDGWRLEPGPRAAALVAMVADLAG